MTEKKKCSYPELWNKWLENLEKPPSERRKLNNFLRKVPASGKTKKILRLAAKGGDY